MHLEFVNTPWLGNSFDKGVWISDKGLGTPLIIGYTGADGKQFLSIHMIDFLPMYEFEPKGIHMHIWRDEGYSTVINPSRIVGKNKKMKDMLKILGEMYA